MDNAPSKVDDVHERGRITNPKSNAKSVMLTAEGERLGEAAFRHFGKAV